MASVNKWIGIGNLTKDPEIRYLQSGEAVTNITVACNEQWKDRVTGEKKESVEFVRVVFFRKLAEIAGEYLKKGSQVYIEGALKTRKWQDKDGQERYTTEIVADSMQMLGSRQGMGDATPREAARSSSTSSSYDAPAKPAANVPASSNTGGGSFNDFEDDIPF